MTGTLSTPDEHAPNVKAYLWVFGALAVLTVLTVAVSYLHLDIGPAVFVAMTIACVKAGLVAAVFMHLKGEKHLIYAMLGVTAFFVLFLYILPIVDFHNNDARVTHTAVAVEEPHAP